jgi:flagellar basal-body rod protein FlgG
VPNDALVVSIARDGIVSVTQPGNPNTVTELGQLQLATFVNTAGLQSQGENLYLETAASGAPQVNNPGTEGLGVLNQSFIETSNVNVAEELVNMIVAQRAFELNSRAITTSDQMLQRLTQL